MAVSALRRLFPRWMAIRDDPGSVGGRLLDFLGERILGENLPSSPEDFWEIALANIRPLVADALPTTARLDQAAWLFVAPLDTRRALPDSPDVQIRWGAGNSVTGRLVDILIELALGSPDQVLAYLDTESNRLFVRPPLSLAAGALPTYLGGATVTYGPWVLPGQSFAPHLLWNAFDELALRLGKRRLLWESNESLLRRCLYTLRFAPDGSPERLACLAAIEAGLVAELQWAAPSDRLALASPSAKDLAHPSALTSTVYLCPVPGDSQEAWSRAWMSGLPAHPSQIRKSPSGTLQVVAELDLLSRPSDWQLFGVHFGVSLPSAAIPGAGSYPAEGLELDEGAVEGSAVLPVLRVGNLGAWDAPVLHFGWDVPKDLAAPSDWLEGTVAEYRACGQLSDRRVWETGGWVRVEVAPAHYQSPTGWRLPASLAVPGVAAELVDFPDAMPLALRITLRRPSLLAPSPKITRFSWSYFPADCVVSYLWGASVHSLSDPVLRPAFYTPEGHPTPILRDILSQVARQAPVLWDQMRWDEHYWDVVKVGQGLASVPARWDPAVELSLQNDSSVWQAGIGDLEDLQVRLQTTGPSASFSPYVAGGYAFSFLPGENVPAPVYRFVRPQSFDSLSLSEGLNSMDPSQLANPSPPLPALGTPMVLKMGDVRFRPAAFLDEQGDLTLRFRGEAISDGTYLILPHDGVAPASVQLPGGLAVDTNRYDGSHRLPLQGQPPPAGTVVPVSYFLEYSYLYDGARLHVYTSRPGTATWIYETAEAGQADIVEDLSLSPLIHPRPAGFLYHTAVEPQVAKLEVQVSPDELLADGKSWAYVEVRTLDRYDNPVRGKTVSGSASLGTLALYRRYGERHIFYYTAPSPQGLTLPTTATLTFSVDTVSATAEVVLR